MNLILHHIDTLEPAAAIDVDDRTGAVTVLSGDPSVRLALESQFKSGFDCDRDVWDGDDIGTIPGRALPTDLTFESAVNRNLRFNNLCTAAKAMRLRDSK